MVALVALFTGPEPPTHVLIRPCTFFLLALDPLPACW